MKTFYQITIDNRGTLFKFNPRKLHVRYHVCYRLHPTSHSFDFSFWILFSFSHASIKIGQLQFCVWDVRYFNSCQSTCLSLSFSLRQKKVTNIPAAIHRISALTFVENWFSFWWRKVSAVPAGGGSRSRFWRKKSSDVERTSLSYVGLLRLQSSRRFLYT